MNTTRFAVLGANGNTGKPAVFHLLEKGANVKAIVHNPSKSEDLKQAGATIEQANLENVDMLENAFQNVDAAYIMVPTGPQIMSDKVVELATLHANNIAEALARAKLNYVVLLSSEGGHLKEGNGIMKTLNIFESSIRQTRITRTIIRPASFMENWFVENYDLMYYDEQGNVIMPSLRQPLEKPFETVSVMDIGKAAADLLFEGPDNKEEKVINLLGPSLYTVYDVASAYSELLGKTVKPEALPQNKWIPALTEAGVGQNYAELLHEMYVGLNNGTINFEENIDATRRGTTTLKTALESFM